MKEMLYANCSEMCYTLEFEGDSQFDEFKEKLEKEMKSVYTKKFIKGTIKGLQSEYQDNKDNEDNGHKEINWTEKDSIAGALYGTAEEMGLVVDEQLG